MDFLISSAWAQNAAGEPNALMSFLPLILIFVVFYFLLIRPQTKRQKEHKQMVEGLAVGNEVVTAGGILGTITEVKDPFVKVKISDGVEITVQKSTISSLMPKGTVKSA